MSIDGNHNKSFKTDAISNKQNAQIINYIIIRFNDRR